jgi:hypothetical protein
MPAFLQNWFQRDAEGLLDLGPPDGNEQADVEAALKDTPPASTFATARAWFDHHVRAGVGRGLNAEAAKESALRLYRQEASSLMEPQWKAAPRFPSCYKCGGDGHKGRYCPAADSHCDYCGKDNHSIVVCRLLHNFCFRFVLKGTP